MARMEFWSVEVKAGEPVKFDPGDNYLHLSQASLAEVKKNTGKDSIPLFVEIGGQKLVLGTLSTHNCSQILFDLFFEKEFVLSHNWKNGSIFFYGYQTVTKDRDTDYEFEKDQSFLATLDRKLEGKDEMSKSAAAKADATNIDRDIAKPNACQVQHKNSNDDDDDEDDENDDSKEEDSDDSEDIVEAENDSSGSEEDSSDESSEENELTRRKAEPIQKRPTDFATQTPVQKKAKLVSPDGQIKGGDGKKGGHTATPYPSKIDAKSSAVNDKTNLQTAKASKTIPCKSCNRRFNSQMALDSHTKAKHSSGK